MRVSLIVAHDRNRAIGVNNTLPWRLSGDLKYFKETTMGHHIIMGRTTYSSIGKPLPGRTSIVCTRNAELLDSPAQEQLFYTASIESAIELARSRGDSECFIIGGGEIYTQALPIVDRIHCTLVDTEVTNADTYFPSLNIEEWGEVSRTTYQSDEKNEYPFSIVVYDRIRI
jgi:dihydrofolate reductase